MKTSVLSAFLSPHSLEPKVPRFLGLKKPMTLEQLRAVFNVPDDDTFQRRGDYNIRNLGRDIGLLSFFLIGINTVDLYNCTGIQNGRLIYNRTKTKNRRQDKAKIDIRIEPEALALIENTAILREYACLNFIVNMQTAIYSTHR